MSKSKASAIIDKAIAESVDAAPVPPAPAGVVESEPGVGHNKPPADTLLQADDLLERFATQYQPTQDEVTKLLADIGGRTEGVVGVPEKITTEAENGIVAAFMETLRTTIKTVDAHREREKAPYLKAERAVQGYFAAMLIRLEKTRDIIQARGNAYIAHKAGLERQRLAAIAEAERLAAVAAAASAGAAAEEALELERAAARARKPENIERLEAQAEERNEEASVSAVEAQLAADQAAEAARAAAASTADMVRTRFDTGHMSTGKQVGYVEITDADKLDKAALWPFIKEEHKLAALKKWAENTSHKRPMEGAIVELRDKADYR